MPPAAAFSHALRVYWEDTDAGGVVFYANYLKYFERARTEWLRAAGVGQQQLAEDSGTLFVVADSRVRYLRPARLDDWLQLTVEPVEIGRARLDLRQRCLRGDELLSEAELQIACVGQGTFKPRRIPNPILERLAALAGTPTA